MLCVWIVSIYLEEYSKEYNFKLNGKHLICEYYQVIFEVSGTWCSQRSKSSIAFRRYEYIFVLFWIASWTTFSILIKWEGGRFLFFLGVYYDF